MEHKWSNKLVEKWSTSLANREVQILTTLRFYLSLARIIFIKKQQQILVRIWAKCNPFTLPVGTSLASLEITIDIPQKLERSAI